jgi:glycosyltransferase involved in cell wall biosynthesis
VKSKTVLISFDTHTPYLAFRVSRLAAELRRRGLEDAVKLRVVLIAGKESTYGWEGEEFEAQYGGVPVTTLSKTFRGLGLRGYFRLSTLKTCVKFFGQLLKHRPKMVLVGGYDRPESMIAGFSSILFRWRVGVLHDSRFNDAESFGKNVVLERMKSLVLRRYQFFMCSGQECVDYSRFLAGSKKPAYFGGWNVVDNEGIGRAADDASGDEAIYQHFGIEKGSPYFLMAIRFIAKKNADRVLEAYSRYRARVGHKAVPLVICGQGELEDDYRKQVNELGISGSVKIVPWLDYSQVPRASRLSTAVLLASTHDQWGLIINEALAAGAPVLVSNRCGAHELVKNGTNGFTFAPGDVDHLSSLLGDIGGDPELLRRLRENAAPSMESFSGAGMLRVYFQAFERFGVLPDGEADSVSTTTSIVREERGL